MTSMLRTTVRALLRRPTFTLVAVVTIALGVGATTAVFSVANAVLVRPLPFQEPERLILLEGMVPTVGASQSESTLLNWAPGFRTLSDVTAYAASAGANLTGAGDPVRVEVTEVTPSFFRVLGVDGLRGRGFLPDEGEAGRTAVAVLSHGLWRDRFSGDPGVIGQAIDLNGRRVSVVGVAPPGLEYPGETQVWLPAAFGDNRIPAGSRLFRIVGRLAPGSTLEAARAEMAAFVDRELQGTWLAQRPPVVRGLHEALVGGVRPALVMLLGAVAFVILIVSANLANLFLARTAERGRELAVRAAMGARKARLAGPVLLESGLVAAAGCALGVLMGAWVLDLILALAPPSVPRLDEVRLDVFVLGAAIAVTALSALLFGAFPAIRAARTDVHERLKEGGRGLGAGRGGRTMSGALVVAEVALTLMLLAGGGLLIRSVQRLQAVDPGFETAGVLTASISLPAAAYPDQAAMTAFFDRALDRVRALPGVESAGAVNYLPLGTSIGYGILFEIEGREKQPGLDDAPTRLLAGPGYFESLGIPVLRGRAFRQGDDADAPPVAVISKSLAEAHWPEDAADAIGARIRIAGPGDWREVVGVVDDVLTWGLETEASPQLYLPYAQAVGGVSRIVVRTASPDPTALTAAVRAEIRALDPSLPVYDIRPMAAWVADHLGPARFNTALLSAFAGLALLLALVGIYGVAANQVVQRTHEIGVRMALGAKRSRVLGLIVGEGLRLAAAGAALGLLGGWALSRFLESLLFGVSATDPATFIAVVALLLAAAAGASAIPARRASRLDPMRTLRTE